MAEIVPLPTGGTLVPPAVPNRSSRINPLAYTGLFESRKDRIEVPVKAFLVFASGHTVLVDTGWSKAVCTDAKGHLGFGLWFASEPVMKEEEAAISRLKKMGLSPSDLDAVILTHMDSDHTSGLQDIKGARAFYATKEEIEAAGKPNPRYNKKFWKDIEIQPLNMEKDVQAPFGLSCDLFGDGSIVVYETPGHTAGSCVVKVTDEKSGKYVLITGDDGYNKNSWEKLNLPGPMADKEQMLKALKWVAAQRKSPDCVGVYAAHDPDMSNAPKKF